MHYNYTTTGVCSRQISFDIEDGKIKNVVFVGGCNGNLKGISSLVEGADAKDIIKRLRGTKCNSKSTSCPDQLAVAIEKALSEIE